MAVSRVRAFDVPVDDEPVTFTLAGQEYHCRPQIASGAILKFGEAVGDEARDAKSLIGALRNFFRSALYPDDLKRFNIALDDPDTAIPMATLSDVASWLAEVYTEDRPTGQPSRPTSTSASSGVASTAGVSHAASTSSRSRRTAAST